MQNIQGLNSQAKEEIEELKKQKEKLMEMEKEKNRIKSEKKALRERSGSSRGCK